MLQQSQGGLKAWHRQPTRQFVSTNAVQGHRTYSRACQASRDFILVRVPFDPSSGVEALSGLDEDQRRFVTENVTPAEHALGDLPAPAIDRSR